MKKESYREAHPENFPTVNDYRNPIIAEAMRGMKYVNMFNRGIFRNIAIVSMGKEGSCYPHGLEK